MTTENETNEQLEETTESKESQEPKPYSSKRIKKIMIDILESEKISTQEELLTKTKSRTGDESISQSTISRYLNGIGYEKRTIGDKSIYVRSTEKEKKMIEYILKKLINYAKPTFTTVSAKAGMSRLHIFTDKGVENSIGEIISIYYEYDILGLDVGKRCVTIYCENKEKSAALRSELKKFANRI